jgi:hypothetical protein
MKTLLLMLTTAAALTVTVAISGFALDAAVLLSIGFGAGLAGLFVADYSRVNRYNLDVVEAPAAKPVRSVPARRRAADVEFATYAGFNTMIS